jgi:glutamate-1-semialdehyde 2,1-aminomutase
MFTPFFTDRPVTDFAVARTADRERYAAFFHQALEMGVYLPPSQFEAAFTSTAHGETEAELLGRAAAAAFARWRG